MLPVRAQTESGRWRQYWPPGCPAGVDQGDVEAGAGRGGGRGESRRTGADDGKVSHPPPPGALDTTMPSTAGTRQARWSAEPSMVSRQS